MSLPFLDVQKVLKYIQPDGHLSQVLKGYEFRLQQQHMLTNVLDAYNRQEIALIEAGTGTGKSTAYLIPAILWAVKNKERTLISTHTINLQEQLLHKDIPLLLRALKVECKAVLVKGMSNYLCLRKLHDAKEEALLFSEQDRLEIQRIEGWSQSTKEGSKTDLPFMPASGIWDKVNAESDTCQHQQCEHFNKCFFFKARLEADDANILIANHHLLFADLACRAESDNYKDAAVLPTYHHVVMDEAHHIEDVATEFFAEDVSRIDVMRIMARLASERQGISSGKIPFLKKKMESFFGRTVPMEVVTLINRLTIDLPGMRRDLLLQLGETFQSFSTFLDEASKSSSNAEDSGETKLRLKTEQFSHIYWKETIVPRVNSFTKSCKAYIQALLLLLKDVDGVKNEKFQEAVQSICLDIQAYALRLDNTCTALEYFINAGHIQNRVRWIETQQLNTLQNVHLVDAELDISGHLANAFFSKFRTVVLCSATMTTNQKFDFIRNRLGINQKLLPNRQVTENIYDSPFNYKEQSLLAVPIDIPAPTDPRFQQHAVEHIWQAIQASHGNAFVLFTSYTMLKYCHQQLAPRLEAQRYVVLKQGDDHRQMLLNKFKMTDRSVLFGADSFWEGVDVVGDALRCVIIVKLPFKVPSEPIVQARMETILEEGGDPFFDYSVPHAIVKFKQGFGRLIRNRRDRGCIVCLDSRLVNKRYGQLFLNSLPECQRLFAPGQELYPQMVDFYKRTYSLALSQ